MMEIVYCNCVLIDLAVVKDIRVCALSSDHLSLNPSFVTYLLSDAGQANLFCLLICKMGLIMMPTSVGHLDWCMGKISVNISYY